MFFIKIKEKTEPALSKIDGQTEPALSKTDPIQFGSVRFFSIFGSVRFFSSKNRHGRFGPKNPVKTEPTDP